VVIHYLDARTARGGGPALYFGWYLFLNGVDINRWSKYTSGLLGHIGPVDAYRVLDRRHTSCAW
jgi:hypothetical protein